MNLLVAHGLYDLFIWFKKGLTWLLRREYYIKRLCKKFKELAFEIINYKEKEMIPITNEENECYEKPKVCYICKEEFSTDKNDKNTFKLYHKVRDQCHYAGKFREAAHSICNLRCKTPKEIPAVAHYATYDHHVIIKQLAKEFDGQFECLGENMEKHINFSVPIKKELDNGKTITYKLNSAFSSRSSDMYKVISPKK